jgi:hypothetical protein
MRFVLTALLLWSGALCQAQQFAFEMWHEGKVVLENGDTLKGTVRYNLQTDLVQLQMGNRLENFSARKAVFFEIFDGTVKRYRQFYSLPFAAAGEYKTTLFFELLEEGKLTVLCREAVEFRTFTSFYFYGTYTRQVLVHKYFVLDERGNIRQVGASRSDWLNAMGNYAEEVQKYAKANRLDFDEKYDLARIIAYYNSLFVKK